MNCAEIPKLEADLQMDCAEIPKLEAAWIADDYAKVLKHGDLVTVLTSAVMKFINWRLAADELC
jgi:hypothetical protein